MEETTLQSQLDAVDHDGYTILPDAIDPDRAKQFLERTLEIEQDPLPAEESGTITTPGTDRDANSAFRHPSTALGR